MFLDDVSGCIRLGFRFESDELGHFENDILSHLQKASNVLIVYTVLYTFCTSCVALVGENTALFSSPRQ